MLYNVFLSYIKHRDIDNQEPTIDHDVVPIQNSIHKDQSNDKNISKYIKFYLFQKLFYLWNGNLNVISRQYRIIIGREIFILKYMVDEMNTYFF